MKTKILVGLLVVLLVIGGYFFLKKNKKEPSILVDQDVVSNQMPAPGEEDVEEMVVLKEINMIAKNWYFEPAEVRVKHGEKIVLKIKSVDVDHGFALPDFDVSVKLKPGFEETVEFTADKKGEFTFFCNVLCGQGHRDMKGKLIVE